MNFNDRLTMFVDALPGLNRIKAVQRALEGRANPVYLEIGVSKGLAFRQISAAEKIAVDPAFRLSPEIRAQADAKGRSVHYFETTSDEFFAEQAEFLAQRPVDVALIDGMHTYEQVVRDVENTLRYLRDDGVIFLHDCNPPIRTGGAARGVVGRLRRPAVGSAGDRAVERRRLEGDRAPAQHAAGSSGRRAEMRPGCRVRPEGQLRSRHCRTR